ECRRRWLDDPGAAQCGRCDTCAGPFLPGTVSDAALASAQAHLGRVGVEITPRRQWPTGLPAIGVPLSGRIPPGEQPLPGRALARLTDLGWGDRLRRLLADGAPAGPPSEEAIAG